MLIQVPNSFSMFRQRIALAIRGLTKSTRAGRANRTSLVAVLGRGLSIIGTLVTIPLVLNHLGVERYGLWTTLTVIFVYLRLADGGVTVGLITLVSYADGAGDQHRIKQLFSSAFVVTAWVTLLLLVVALLVGFVDWGRVLNLSDPKLKSEAAASAVIIILAIAMGYPASVVRQGRLGLQQGAAANTWDIAATLITFAGQLSIIFFGFGIVALAAVTAFTPVMVNIASSVHFLTGSGRHFAPSTRLASGSTIRTLFLSGSMFTALTFSQALSVQIDIVLVARLMNVGAVTDYSIIQKMLTQPLLIVTMYLTAQFPAYGEALTCGDHSWIARHFRQTLLVGTFFSILVCGSLAVFADPIIDLWIGSAIAPSPILTASMAVYAITATIANVCTYFFFALGLYRRVILAHIGMIAINIPLALLLIPRIGSAGACLATACGYVATLIIPSLIGFRSVLRNLPELQSKALARTHGVQATGHPE